jgi:hypothetical protein
MRDEPQAPVPRQDMVGQAIPVGRSQVLDDGFLEQKGECQARRSSAA